MFEKDMRFSYTVQRMNRYMFLSALKITMPVFFGYIAIGIPFGLIVTTAGYPWWVAPVMNLVMLAGAGEYVAIGLFVTGVPFATIAITELFINIRHIFYGLSLITNFKSVGKWKPYLIFALTDETYALLTGVEVPKNVNAGNFYGIISLLNHFYWVLGGLIGSIAGTLLPFSFEGVDFALTALFAVLLINQIKASKELLPSVIGVVVTVIPIILTKFDILNGQQVLIVALTFGIAILMGLKGRVK